VISTRAQRRSHRAGVQSAGPFGTLSDTTLAWLSERLLLGASREALVAQLSEDGTPRAIGERAIEGILGSPIHAGALRAARRAKRYELLNRLERETARLAREPFVVERRSRLSPEELFDRYYAHGIPVIITDALEPWPAVLAWSPPSLKERFGHVQVEVTTGRDADPAADAHYAEHSRPMLFGDFCDRIETGGPTNDFYMIANNLNGERGLAPLFDDLRGPHPYLDDERLGRKVLFWFGPAGTVTPLHHDTSNVLLCQAFGSKRVVLVPRFEVAITDEMRDEVYSRADPDHPGQEPFPWPEGVVRQEVTLGRGETLFVPVGCFHHVTALEPSLTVAFTNFSVPNEFLWYHPGRYR